MVTLSIGTTCLVIETVRHSSLDQSLSELLFYTIEFSISGVSTFEYFQEIQDKISTMESVDDMSEWLLCPLVLRTK